MQTLWWYLLIISLVIVVHGNFETKENDIQSISSGLSFGMCRGYCQSSINITSNPFQLVASKEPNFAQKDFPSLQRQFPFSSNEWNQLVSLVNMKIFTALDDTVGCPGCADGGIEWIQVDWIDGTKRVTFESGNAIKGMEGIVEKLQQMRDNYLSQLENIKLSA